MVMIKGKTRKVEEDSKIETAKSALIILNKSFPGTNWKIEIDRDRPLDSKVSIVCGRFSVNIHSTYIIGDPFRYGVEYFFEETDLDVYELGYLFRTHKLYKRPDIAVRRQITAIKNTLKILRKRCNDDISLIMLK